MGKIGTHCILELYGCPRDLLNDATRVQQALSQAVEHSSATLLQQISHQFHPQGVTVLGLLSESHISIHTWPEFGYAAAVVFTCGQRCNPRLACEYLAQALQADRHELKTLERGEIPVDHPAMLVG